MTLLERLRLINPGFRLFDTADPDFAPYGLPLEGDFEGLIAAMDDTVPIPAEGVAYVPSHPPLETAGAALAGLAFGGMAAQIGYCAGRNSTLNGLEYHKCSEIVAAADDLVLLLGLRSDLEREDAGFSYDSSRVVGLLLLRGQAVELFTGTLHLAPCRVRSGGFRAAILLARGTNIDYAAGEKPTGDPLLLKRNKWIIAHPERAILVKQGVPAGIRGPNRELVTVTAQA